MQWNPEYFVKFSGEKQQFASGATREAKEGKGRFDLISPRFLRRLALVLERGAQNHGDRNWEKGIPLHGYIDSALRHIIQLMLGDKSEDHAAQAAWNLHALIHTAELIAEGKLPANLDDINYASKPAYLTDQIVEWLSNGPVSVQQTWDHFRAKGYTTDEVLDAIVALRDGKGILTYSGTDSYKLVDTQ